MNICTHVKVLVTQSCPTLCDPMDCIPPVSSVLGVLQARMLEWITILLSRGSSQPRDGNHVSCFSCTGRQDIPRLQLGSPSSPKFMSIQTVMPRATWIEQLTCWKRPDARKDWRQKENRVVEDEIVGWHHQLNRRELGWTPGDGEGQGGLECCSPWGYKEWDIT